MSSVPSTAATSVSGGDSTSTTPGPSKKDFAGFGVTPTGTPAPEEKEQKGLAFGGTSSSSTATEEKKEGVAAGAGFAFGAKKEEDKTEPAAKGPAGVSAEPKGDAAIQNMKNKTMEEIIQKWTGELDRCSEQFKTQANNIRRWDSVLFDNGDKVQPSPPK
jgi:nuclear pore complex protein Nup62